jgi:hypothetical protein
MAVLPGCEQWPESAFLFHRMVEQRVMAQILTEVIGQCDFNSAFSHCEIAGVPISDPFSLLTTIPGRGALFLAIEILPQAAKNPLLVLLHPQTASRTARRQTLDFIKDRFSVPGR